MYELLEKLEALIARWENVPYTGDPTKAARSVCAQELRQVLGHDARLEGYEALIQHHREHHERRDQP